MTEKMGIEGFFFFSVHTDGAKSSALKCKVSSWGLYARTKYFHFPNTFHEDYAAEKNRRSSKKQADL